MCDLRNNYTPNEILDHPKLSDDYKLKYFFSLTLQEEFYGLLNSLGLGLNNLGLTIGDVDNLDYIWDVNAEDDKYINSQTSAFENEDEISLYRYISTEAYPSFISSETNAFCMNFMKRTNDYLMQKEDMKKLKDKYFEDTENGLFNFGYRDNCSHMFVKYRYNTKTKKLLKSNKEEFSRIEFKKWRNSNVSSSNVKNILYNDENKELVIQFNDKSIYTYFDISFETYRKISTGDFAPITTGSNEYGSWEKGVKPSIGAGVHQALINKGVRYKKGGTLK